jgi:hypothetical protein
MKPVKVIFSDEAQQVYDYLTEEAKKSKVERSILKAIDHKIKLINSNEHYGNPIAKKLIPKDYLLKGITNLFRVELPNYWRMIYTLGKGNQEVIIVAIVLDIFDHKDYNKKFGYRNT